MAGEAIICLNFQLSNKLL